MTGRGYILVVDDELAIRVSLGEELTQAGYAVLTAASGEEALALLQEESVDLVLLDLKMGGIDGLQVMAELEKQPLPPVVIILTAHASFDLAVGAIRRGGYDYLVKPYSIEELLASVEKGMARRQEVLRQQKLVRLIEDSARQLQTARQPEKTEPPTQPHILERRGLLLDRERLTVTRSGQPVHLTSTEFRLLLYLMARAGQVVSFRELMRELHGREEEVEEAREALQAHLHRLRQKIGNGLDGVPYIANVRGQGYKFIG
jgi:DNA-binding response OmpR family regulator